jgi:hypothetical protein
MRNLIEDLAEDEYKRLVSTVEGFCGCEQCRVDVLVYALNRVAPHYVAQPTGEALAHVRMQAEQQVADISVVLLEGFRKVTAAPRPGHQAR